MNASTALNPTSELSHAGLAHTKQVSRFVYCSAHYAAMNDLLAFLTENGCAGSADNNCTPQAVQFSDKPKSQCG